MGERNGAYRDVMGKPKGKRQFGKPRHRWKDGSSGSGGMDWIWPRIGTGGGHL